MLSKADKNFSQTNSLYKNVWSTKVLINSSSFRSMFYDMHSFYSCLSQKLHTLLLKIAEAVAPRCSAKKVFLEISPNS